ncbi:MAG: DeoR/GlpR transcriptional regulator [Clostridia bacterium]|nr:DeoR/GlpR transcriptional regulator [Clostridia bacterium]
MTTEERRTKLYEMLQKEKVLDVNYIRDYFNVSAVTVRNDLIALERNSLVTRQFGKALLKQRGINDKFESNTIKNLEEKEKIGKYAAKLVNPEEAVLIYAGTTTLQVARYLPESINLCAVTNSIYIANELKEHQNVKTVFIGGNFNGETGSTYGVEAIAQLNKYNIDKLFLAVCGIDTENGVTSDQPFETDINIAMIERAREVIVVADHTKIGKVHFTTIGCLDKISMIITDAKTPEEDAEKFRKLGIEVVTV